MKYLAALILGFILAIVGEGFLPAYYPDVCYMMPNGIWRIREEVMAPGTNKFQHLYIGETPDTGIRSYRDFIDLVTGKAKKVDCSYVEKDDK